MTVIIVVYVVCAAAWSFWSARQIGQRHADRLESSNGRTRGLRGNTAMLVPLSVLWPMMLLLQCLDITASKPVNDKRKLLAKQEKLRELERAERLEIERFDEQQKRELNMLEAKIRQAEGHDEYIGNKGYKVTPDVYQRLRFGDDRPRYKKLRY